MFIIPFPLKSIEERRSPAGVNSLSPIRVYEGVRDAFPAEWVDRTGTAGAGNLKNPTEVTQPDRIEADPNFNNRPTLFFNRANNDIMLEAITGSAVNPSIDLKCLHDGTGGTLVTYIRPSDADSRQTIARTMAVFATVDVGLFIRYDGSIQAVRAAVLNGSGFVVDIQSANGTVAVGDKGILITRFKAGESPEFDVNWKGVSLGTDSIGGAPSTANPQSSFAIGRRADASQPFSGTYAAVMVFPSYLTDVQVTTVRDYLITVYGPESE